MFSAAERISIAQEASRFSRVYPGNELDREDCPATGRFESTASPARGRCFLLRSEFLLHRRQADFREYIPVTSLIVKIVQPRVDSNRQHLRLAVDVFCCGANFYCTGGKPIFASISR